MKILITGSSGNIGKELVKKLNGHELHLWDIKDGFDIAEAPLSQTINMVKPEIVYHLAATFERTKETPEAFGHIWNNDTLASHRLIEAVVNCDSVKTFVFASSYLIYELQYMSKLKEDFPIMPRNLCGYSKLYTEKELNFVSTYLKPGLKVINARIFRVYGPGGKEVISRWCKYKQYGAKADVFNKENSFDFIHSRDVAEGLLRLSECEAGTYNLGTGVSHSIEEVLKLIDIPYSELEPDLEYENSCADITKLEKETGWKPEIGLADGIKEVLDFERKQKSKSG